MLVIPIASDLYKILKKLAHTRRVVFITGLPGVGKSLLIQQLALIANEAGRKVHLLQWIMARKAFETENNLSHYPEVAGVTDLTIRKAVGLWSRQAVWQWHNRYVDPEHLLIGELPLIGNRLLELVEVQADVVESFLSSESVQFVIPVPSWEVREVIEAARERTIAQPRHEQEKQDAIPSVLRALWQEVNAVAREIGLTKASPTTPYNPYIYGGVYQALLRNRHNRALLIDQVLKPTQSVYELDVVESELQATPDEVAEMMKLVEQRYGQAELEQLVNDWYRIITKGLPPPKRGPNLQLPMPEMLPTLLTQTSLSPAQLSALKNVTTMPLDSEPEVMIPVLDEAMAALGICGEKAAVAAEVHKFDVYDSYFNVTRTDEDGGIVFLCGLLMAYRNMMDNLMVPPYTLTVVEVPLLRIALETTLRQFVGM